MLREVGIFQVPSCHKNREKLQRDRPLSSYADFTYHMIYGGSFFKSTRAKGLARMVEQTINNKVITNKTLVEEVNENL